MTETPSRLRKRPVAGTGARESGIADRFHRRPSARRLRVFLGLEDPLGFIGSSNIRTPIASWTAFAMTRAAVVIGGLSATPAEAKS